MKDYSFVKEILNSKCKETRIRPMRTSFQTSSAYLPWIDIKTDIVIINGTGKERIKSWKDKGYEVYVMGGFRENKRYLLGEVDGKKHQDEVQVGKNGKPFTINSGYYMVPTKERIPKFMRYYQEAIEQGASAICPEEPEFFVGAGYSKAFKKEWKAFYQEEWQDLESSIEARFKGDQLKAEMELRMISKIFQSAREHKEGIKNFLLIHSPINYSAWGISFPHSKAIKLPTLDEVIAQVWTGTARSPVKHKGKIKERTFENAFCEYSSMWNLVRGTRVNLWFLADPVEDKPNLPVEDYHQNYEDTITASLFFPEVSRFEVMPWPRRIFGEGTPYKVTDEYATEIITVVNALSDLGEQREIAWDAGAPGIGVLISDSLMWQRANPYPSSMDSYYGLTIPLIRQGIPVQTMNIERISDAGYLKGFKVLLLSYDAWKPIRKEEHKALSNWVKKGGVLIFLGGSNPYNNLKLWWREEGYSAPQNHLFDTLGLGIKLSSMTTLNESTSLKRKRVNFTPQIKNQLTRALGNFSISKDFPLTLYQTTTALPIYQVGRSNLSLVFEQKIGRGYLVFVGLPSQFFAESEFSDKFLRQLVKYALVNKLRDKYKEPGYMKIRRGKYLIARSLSQPLTLKGKYLNLYDYRLGIIKDKKLKPGEGAFLIDLSRLDLSYPRLLASAGRIACLKEEKRLTQFVASGPEGIRNYTRIFSGKFKVEEILAATLKGEKQEIDWQEEGKTFLLNFDNQPEGLAVRIVWR